MLLDGFNHVAVLTSDTERLQAFYTEVFDAEVAARRARERRASRRADDGDPRRPGRRAQRVPDQGEQRGRTPDADVRRGRLDHLALQAASLEAFETIRDRLMARGAADDFVTDFGPILSVFFRDPDGLECEVCVANPDAVPGVGNPPGTPRRATRKSHPRHSTPAGPRCPAIGGARRRACRRDGPERASLSAMIASAWASGIVAADRGLGHGAIPPGEYAPVGGSGSGPWPRR